MIGIPVPIEHQIFLVHPLKGVPRHIVEPVLSEEGPDAPSLCAKLDGRAVAQANRLREADFREIARPELRIALLADKVAAFPEGKVGAPSCQIEPGLEFIPSSTGSLRACVRVVVTRQVGEPDPELIPPGESREIAGRFQDQLGAGGNDEVVPRIERTVQFEQGLSIAEGPGTSFAEVIEALELAEGDLDRVSGVFYNLAGADSTDAREALMRELAPKMSAFSSEVTNNKALWAKIDALWQGREGLGLGPEPLRVLELYRQMFVRSGAALEAAAADRLTAVKMRLAVLESVARRTALELMILERRG